jgi:hypothetical protein
MLQTRRGFLIGSGSLLTTSFVGEARSFIHRTGQPLLVKPTAVTQTLYAYDFDENGITLSLGKWQDEPPPPPTWAEFFADDNVPPPTKEEARQICGDGLIRPRDFDEVVDQGVWFRHCGYDGDRCANAYWLLDAIDVGPALRSAGNPRLQFNRSGPSDSHWVNANSKLALSILQARLIDLCIPIKIEF